MLRPVIPELLPLPLRLEGPRILLRPFGRGDGPGLFASISEDRAHLDAWLPWVGAHENVLDSEVYARKAHAWWILRDDLPMAIETGLDGIIGGTGLHRFDWAQRSFEIGYWLRKSAEGHGYVREAVMLLSALAFDRLDATRVQIHCRTANERSAAVPRRLGFGEERRTEVDDRLETDEPVPLSSFTLTREGFDRMPWANTAIAYVRRADSDG